MNSLLQLESGILGSQADCEALAEKKSAKLMVISDSHGRHDIMRALLLKYGESCDALLFAGDGIMDLAACLEEAYTETYFMSCIPPVIAFVRGNNDPPSVRTSFNPYPDGSHHAYFSLTAPRSTVLKAAGKKILLTHGHECGVYYSTDMLRNAAAEQNADAAVFGHTHCPAEIRRGIYLMNPGSISCPRNLSKAGFAFIQIAGKELYSVFYRAERNASDYAPYTPDFLW